MLVTHSIDLPAPSVGGWVGSLSTWWMETSTRICRQPRARTPIGDPCYCTTAAAPMIGYYVHHQGSGHLHRALSVNHSCSSPMTGLSTLGRPAGWVGNWVRLADDADTGAGTDPTANGRLHYVPIDSTGLTTRMTAISNWMTTTRPSLMVVDVSVEVAVLARLHGIAVTVIAQPGRRLDPAHRLGYDVADRIVAPWPEALGGIWGATASDLTKAQFVGAISRYDPRDRADSHDQIEPHDQQPDAHADLTGRRRVLVMNGTGGRGVRPEEVDAARAATPDWEWTHLDRDHGTWTDDPWPLLRSATVVITHAGQNAVAEVAAARRPALLIPQARPFDEQQVLAAALQKNALPVRVRQAWPAAEEWPQLLDELAGLDPTPWSTWCDGAGQLRLAELLTAPSTGTRIDHRVEQTVRVESA